MRTYPQSVAPARLLEVSDEDGPRHLVLLATPDLAAAAEAVRDLRATYEVADGFAILVALDAEGEPVQAIADLATECNELGLFWVSTWGPACERVHDIFDELDVSRLLHQPAGLYDVIMSTWHDNEPFRETLQFFWGAASPGPQRRGGALRLVLTVGMPHLVTEVHHFVVEEASSEER